MGSTYMQELQESNIFTNDQWTDMMNFYAKYPNLFERVIIEGDNEDDNNVFYEAKCKNRTSKLLKPAWILTRENQYKWTKDNIWFTPPKNRISSNKSNINEKSGKNVKQVRRKPKRNIKKILNQEM